MITIFRQNMVTIRVSDHHMDDEKMRRERLWQATLDMAKSMHGSVLDGTFAKIGLPEVKVQCLYHHDDRFDPMIQVLIYGVPREKRQLVIRMWNTWDLPANRWMHTGPWFRDDEIGLNVELCDGNVCNIYSRMTVIWERL